MFDVLAASSRAIRSYRPPPYDGEITLFRTSGHPREPEPDPTWGWERLARSGVVVRRIPGNHMNLLRQPHVRSLAQELQACLESARPSGAAAGPGQPALGQPTR